MTDTLLKSSGLKNTPIMRGIVEIISSNVSPLSPSDILYALKGAGRSADLSTVYRALKRLKDSGIITKLTLSSEPCALYEYNGEHRHYLVCVNCKKILPLEGCPLGEYEKTLEEKTSYKISSHKLSVYGICPDCQKH